MVDIAYVELVSLRDVDIRTFLGALRLAEGSDLHLKEGAPPRIRMDGLLHDLNAESLSASDLYRFACETMPDHHWEDFSAGKLNEIDFAYDGDNRGRYRVNCFRQRGTLEIIMRRLLDEPLTFSELGLPDSLERLVDIPRGIVLVTGPTGSGKTTTLAALIEAINRSRAAHIVTIEDPIEIVHKDKRSSVTQRELGTDTADYVTAMRAVLRQDPDVILVGEIRDTESVRGALHASETGHLLLSTLHTTDAAETINRVIDLFPPHQEQQVRIGLAAHLRAVLSQRLVPKKNGEGRVAAMEVLFGSGLVSQAIIDAQVDDVRDIMARDEHFGMQTFEQALATLVLTEEIDLRVAMQNSSRPQDLRVVLEHAGLRVG